MTPELQAKLDAVVFVKTEPTVSDVMFVQDKDAAKDVGRAVAFVLGRVDHTRTPLTKDDLGPLTIAEFAAFVTTRVLPEFLAAAGLKDKAIAGLPTKGIH